MKKDMQVGTTQVPQNNDFKIVRFTNIAPFDFSSEMGAMYGGQPYFVPSGKSLLMPLTVGDHLATHLARQIIIQKAPIRDEKELDGKGSDRKLWDPKHIEDLKAQIVSQVYEEEQQAPKTRDEMLRAKIDELNKQFPEAHLQNGAPTAPPPPAPAPTPSVVPAATVVAPTAPTTPPADTGPKVYQDKAEVIAALKAKDIKFDARKSKSDLEKLLK